MSSQAGSRAAAVPCVCLVVLDGWGLAEPGPGNAISLAHTPVFDKLWASYPHTTLTACGAAVGLPDGQMGNSEVGHLNLGAGAVVKQDLVRIGEAIEDGSLARNEVLRDAFTVEADTDVLPSAPVSTSNDEHTVSSTTAPVSASNDEHTVSSTTAPVSASNDEQTVSSTTAPVSASNDEQTVSSTKDEGQTGVSRRVHLLGLVSDGGVHSSLEHLLALIGLAGEIAPAADVVVHAFTDGRDTLPHAGAGYLAELDQVEGARVGSVVGRYWAMDRDRRWDRTQRAYDMLVHGRAPQHSTSGEQAVRDAYERGETDEFIEPTLVGEEARIRPGDSVVCFNFRPDRMRQIVRALAEPGFGEHESNIGVQAKAAGIGGIERVADEELLGWEGRGGASPVERLSTLTEYEEGWPYPVAFAPQRPEITLSEVIARDGARQLHVAETEKYPHVTYFFNGGEETPCSGERRELVPSPRDVPTYDHKPQMSAREAAAAFVGAWSEDLPEFGIINFANADMVGHTGVIPAAVAAIETVDECLGEVLAAVGARGGVAVVTADHGNADNMLEPDGSPNTAHSLNPVPLILTAPDLRLRAQGGILADVAPTVLELLGIEQPPQMTGESLIVG